MRQTTAVLLLSQPRDPEEEKASSVHWEHSAREYPNNIQQQQQKWELCGHGHVVVYLYNIIALGEEDDV